ncbi:MAG TPA: alpha/beta fold hydrolase [Gemmatimonadales bacterium]|nr:alpha/beta fold hydrolase [Gemmatimonadales bacterium]
MTTLPPVELKVYAYECDAYGHLNHAALLSLLERARWESLAQGPGMDVFHRNGIAPVVRRVVVEYRAAAFPGDALRVESSVTHRGTTSWTVRQFARRVVDDILIAEAELVFVSVDRAGRPTPLPEELGRVLGAPRAGGAEVRRVAVPGGELAVEVRGEGPAILFVHGFPLDRTVWRHQFATLSRWQRIAPDLRGVGESSGDGYSIARYADDVVACLDAVGVESAVVCGLSMGGYVLFELLRRHAARLRAVVLCGTRPAGDTEEAKRGRDELAALARDQGVRAVGERMLPRLLAGRTQAEQPEVVEHYREMVSRWSGEGMAGALRAMRDRVDSTAVLGEIRVPTLVLVGSEDAASPVAVGESMAAAIAGARLAVVPAAGHLAPLEQPLSAGRALSEFLDRLK